MGCDILCSFVLGRCCEDLDDDLNWWIGGAIGCTAILTYICEHTLLDDMFDSVLRGIHAELNAIPMSRLASVCLYYS